MILSSQKKRRLAIIPARGGSKRIHKKNIKFFLGIPIILRVLKEVSESNLFDEIHVSTEDEEIAKIVTSAGFEIKFLRDNSLSCDDTPLGDVIKEVIEKYKELGQSFDTIAMIFSTAVLIDSDLIKMAINEFENGDTSIQLLSISKFPAPIERAMRMSNNNTLTSIDLNAMSLPSNNLSEAWYETGDFVIYSESGALQNNASSPRRGFCLPRWLSVDIDNIDDWEAAEWIYKKIYSH
jgi:pseudaminic acid cytidylyltransferase